MRSRYTIFAALAYLAITIAVTYPVAFQLTTHIAGLPGNDSLEFVWSMWWFKHALLDLHTSPINISVLNYPAGLSFPLLPSMSQSFILGLPLTALVSPVFAFNIVYLLSFPACAFSGYWLCFDLTQDRRAAFLGGLIWGFFPSKSAHALAGHLFQLVVFTFPIATLFLLRALRSPSLRNAVLAGIFIALAATVHPINVAYFILPVGSILVLFAIWEQRWSFPTRVSLQSIRELFKNPLLQSILIVGVTAALLALPVFLPTLLGGRQLDYLAGQSIVGFSLDLSSFFIPAPNHPLVGGLPFSNHLFGISFFEFEHVAYLGLIPLILAAIGWWTRRRESRQWALLAIITAVLSLGPILQIFRRHISIPVEGNPVPILMPYALLEQLPFFQWSRTPGRLNETTIFAIMILAAFGIQALLSRIKLKQLGLALWLGACLLIPVEYLVRWPMPTGPIPTSAGLEALKTEDPGTAVMNYPISAGTYYVNLFPVFQQTVHQHPLIGGRVYRDQPGSLALHEFLSQLIATALDSGDDITPAATNDQRLATFNYYNVSHIIYQPEGDPDGSRRLALDALVGSPASTDEIVSIYNIPKSQVQITDPIFIFGSNWYAPESWQAPTRWFKGIATLYAFSPQATRGTLSFTAIPGNDLRRLLIKVNGIEIAHFAVGDWGEYQTPPITLNEGINTIQFFDEDGSWSYVGDPRCQHGSAVAGPFPFEVPCNAADSQPHDYSLAIQDLRFGPQPTQPVVVATFGETLELLNAAAPETAQAGDAITAHFTWRTTATLSTDYTMFVHLLDSNGQLVVGNDSAPARGGFPTTRWQAGQIVSYNVPLTLPADLPAGTYTVEAGWYTWPSLERLTLENGADAFNIGVIQITP